ncbi:OmpW/AlkL family protein, partial [Aeromonas veronii]
TAPWDTVHHGNFCAVGYHNPKREKVSGPMGSNPYTTFFDEKGVGALDGANISLDDSWGLAGQVGIDMAVTDRWFVNGSAWIMDIDTDVKVDGVGTFKTHIDPMAFMVGVGYRF